MPDMLKVVSVLLVLLLAASAGGGARAQEFSFADIVSLDDMHSFARRDVPLGTTRDAVRAIFVRQGGAERFAHPELPGVEKYVYDINLCRLYVWRWNISANFDAAGALTQIYVNGETVHSLGDPPIDTEERAREAEDRTSISLVTMPRPEADQGENVLSFILIDLDTESSRETDEFIMGAGPSRADPNNLGFLHAYSVEAWRSIFAEETPRIVDYRGVCP
jgi:hypothetical protein